ncbi:MAG: hypothetical protein OHK0052_15570 [Anaerolineales bacterium]
MPTPDGRTVGLALGGGVLRGFAHLGALSVLVRENIPIDYVAGTSAGSIMGAFYCIGFDAQQGMEIAKKTRWYHLVGPAFPARGLVSFWKLERWLIKHLGDVNFSDLQRPFAAVAVDVNTYEKIVLREGRLAPAVRASCSVPGAISPVRLNGRWLGDGSLVDSLPVSVLREMGAHYTIAIDIFQPAKRRYLGPLGYALAALEILLQRAGGGITQADCLIQPRLQGVSYLRFSLADSLFECGARAMQEKIPQIRRELGLPQPEEASA